MGVKGDSDEGVGEWVAVSETLICYGLDLCLCLFLSSFIVFFSFFFLFSLSLNVPFVPYFPLFFFFFRFCVSLHFVSFFFLISASLHHSLFTHL